MCIHYRSNIQIIPPGAAKVATFVKFFKIEEEKNPGMICSLRFVD